MASLSQGIGQSSIRPLPRGKLSTVPRPRKTNLTQFAALVLLAGIWAAIHWLDTTSALTMPDSDEGRQRAKHIDYRLHRFCAPNRNTQDYQGIGDFHSGRVSPCPRFLEAPPRKHLRFP